MRLVIQVLDWLEDDLQLGEYRREFARAKVDGALLLNLEVSAAGSSLLKQASLIATLCHIDSGVYDVYKRCELGPGRGAYLGEICKGCQTLPDSC